MKAILKLILFSVLAVFGIILLLAIPGEIYVLVAILLVGRWLLLNPA